VMSFISDLYSFPANTITSLTLQLFNYGDYDARNIQSKLIGYQGSESYVNLLSGSNYEDDILQKNNALNFFWQLRFLDPGVYSDVTYSMDTKTYYEYESNATREIAFTFQSGTPSITASSGQTRGPINVSLSSQSFVYIPEDGGEFTVTVRIDNIDDGYPTCRHSGTGDTLIGTGSYCDTVGTSEREEYRNYIKSIQLYIPQTWELKKPEEWEGSCTNVAGSSLKLCEYSPDFSDSTNVDRRLYLTQGLRNTFNIGFTRGTGTGSSTSVTCQNGYCSNGECFPSTISTTCLDAGCSCNAGLCQSYDKSLGVYLPCVDDTPICPSGYTRDGCTCTADNVGSPSCPSGFTQSGCTCYEEAGGDDELVESMKIVLKYSYVIPSRDIDLTVRGSQQTY
jgi:hypothetical protein